MSGALRVAFVATTGLLASSIATVTFFESPPPERLRAPLASIGASLGGWTATRDEILTDRTLRVLAPTEYLLRTYEKDGRTAGLFVAFYAQQKTGESMHSPEACLPGEGWSIEQRRTIQVPSANAPANLYSIRNGTDRALVLYWFQSRRRIVASELTAKLLLIRDALIDRVTGGTIVRLTLADEPGAVQSGLSLSTALIPEVARCL